MGAKLGKLKTLVISEKNNQQEKTLVATSINGAALEPQRKKKKEKSSNNKVDKCIDTTDGVRLPLSNAIQFLNVARSTSRLNDVHHGEVFFTYSLETPSKDVLEFREACIRRGIISPDMTTRLLVPSNEANNQSSDSETLVENSTTITITNNETTEDEHLQAMSQ